MAGRASSTPIRGAQFTTAAFTDKLEAAGVSISMDGRRGWLDNVFVERLWRSLKYEEVHRLCQCSRGAQRRRPMDRLL
jgi:transposase InsO family protein